MWTPARLRTLATWSAIALAVVLVVCELGVLVGAQTPRTYYDTQVYFQAAERPLGLEQFFYGKPAFMPLVHRLTGPAPATIANVQAVLALLAWGTLAVVLVMTLRHGWVRAVAGVACAAFLLAGPRVGFASAVLSESINDSLAALVAAGALALGLVRQRARVAVAIATGALTLAWIFTRDSNAIAALVLVVMAALVWPVRRWWREARWAVVLAGVTAIGALFSLYSTRQQPTPLPFQAQWRPELTARAAYPMVNNILWRVLATDRAWLAERGGPVDELARFTEIDHALQARPEFAAFQDWLIAHGQWTYLRWLVRHPIDRTLELAGAWQTVLAGNHRPMMPSGYVAQQNIVLDLFRRLTTNRWLVLVLLLSAPYLLRRPRGHVLAGIATCMIASGILGAAASYYGDAAELDRHCYGAGQQIVLGCFLALLANLDRVRAPASRTAPPDPSRAAA